MQNRSNAKKRDDIKVVITATALTLALAFWNFFSNGAQKPVPVVNLEPTIPQAAQVKILLGGPPPRTTILVSQPNPVKRHNQQQNQQSAPQPVTRTASSK